MNLKTKIAPILTLKDWLRVETIIIVAEDKFSRNNRTVIAQTRKKWELYT
jgi:hypothetical protein